MKHRINVHEGAASVDETVAVVQEMRSWRVLTPLFKRGREWAVGEVIELDVATGERFAALGEVEEVIDI